MAVQLAELRINARNLARMQPVAAVNLVIRPLRKEANVRAFDLKQ